MINRDRQMGRQDNVVSGHHWAKVKSEFEALDPEDRAALDRRAANSADEARVARDAKRRRELGGHVPEANGPAHNDVGNGAIVLYRPCRRCNSSAGTR